MPKVPISFLVLTKNEEQDLPKCLAAAQEFDEIIVFDSFSTDRTVEIAKSFGAKVVQRTFDNWSTHQNWGLRNIEFAHPWVYYSDADEIVPPELVEEMRRVVATAPTHSAFRLHRHDHFMGKWLKYVIPSPFNIRLFRPELIEYERFTNPITIVKGTTGQLSGYFNHYPFSKGMNHWLAKHNSYSAQEAAQIVKNQDAGLRPNLKTALFGKDINERRKHQKEIFYQIPMRPFSKFMILYFFKLGFLDGYPGLTYAVLQSIYEYMIVLKTCELRSHKINLPTR